MKEAIQQVVIVGAGPAGLTAAIYSARAGLRPLVLTGSSGGQLATTSDVENFPGFPEGVTGPELIDKMTAQAKKFGALFLDVSVKRLEAGAHPFVLWLDNNESCRTNSVIVATGASAKYLGLPGESRFVNKGISACATCDGPLKVFRNKVIVVVGGGDSACEEALFLTKFASQVLLVHRRDSLRASKIMIERVETNPKIQILWNTIITGYEGDDFLSGVRVVSNGGTERRIACGGLFMAIGHSPNVKFLEGSNVKLSENGYLDVKNNILTSVDGVFAAGDVHDSHFRQAVTASGFGCMAAIACERWLSERK